MRVSFSVVVGSRLGGLARRLRQPMSCLTHLTRHVSSGQAVRHSLPRLQVARPTCVHLTRLALNGVSTSPMHDTRLIMNYTPLSDADRALADSLAEVTLKESEEAQYAYAGYTTPRIQAARRRIMQPAETEDESGSVELHECIAVLSDELAAMLPYVGQRRARLPSAACVLRHRWQQRQAELHDRNAAFRVPPVESAPHKVVISRDGQESLARYCRDSATTNGSNREQNQSGIRAMAARDGRDADDAGAHDAAQSLPPPKYVVIGCDDVNHVRYLLALAYRRVHDVAAAEKVLYDILATDVANVDALECLLELYLGLDDVVKLRQLLVYLDSRDEAARRPTLAPQADTRGEEDRAAAGVRDADACSESDALAALLAEDASPRTTASGAQAAATLLSMSNDVASREVALQLLVDLLLESVAQRCAVDGEGTAARYALGNITLLLRGLHEMHGRRLVELLLSGLVERHALLRHRVRRATHDDGQGVPDHSRSDGADTRLIVGDAELLLSSTITAVLRALLLPHIARTTSEPLRFRSVVLHYLTALQHDMRCLPATTKTRRRTMESATADTYSHIGEPPHNICACHYSPQD